MSVSLRASLSSLTAYDLHKRLINEYVLCHQGATQQLKRDISRDKRDIDVIRENHRFLWEEEDVPESWEERLAKKYYDKLFKEYCVCDLKKYKENKVAMRWRTENEVVTGTGQFSCGSVNCTSKDRLRTWEVNFAYYEKGEKKNALVKLRLCPDCSDKLNYSHKKREVVKSKRKQTTNNKEDNISKRRKSHVDEGGNAATTPEEVPEQPVDESIERKLWKEASQKVEEKTREEEFEEYLEALLL